jgi:hypothetical protein
MPTSGRGSEDGMAKVIEFYVPENFRKNSKWVPPDNRGKLLQFPQEQRKTA